MHIVLVNQFFPPAQAPTGRLLKDVAQALQDRGHRVTVITSAAAYGTADTGPERPSDQGYTVLRPGRTGAHGSGIVSKLVDYARFYRATAVRTTHLLPKPDVALFMTTPPLIGLVGARLRKRHAIPYVLWCMDLYPEALAAHGLVRGWNPLYQLLRRLARCERREAARVVTLGPDMTRLVQADAAGSIAEIPVWCDLPFDARAEAESRRLRRERGWGDDEVVFLYSGNMGRAHRAEEFAMLADMLKSSGVRNRVVMAGSGPNLGPWRDRFGSLLQFIPPAPSDAVAAHLLSADVHLVSQQSDWTGVVVPSKFQAACASGRPVIYAGPAGSAVADWIGERDAGWVIPPGDAQAIARVARDVTDPETRRRKGGCARSLFQDRFTMDANCAALVRLLELIVE